MLQPEYISALIDYISSSPSPFHVVSSSTRLLTENGFTPFVEQDNWNRLPAGKYLISRNDSSLIALSWNPDKRPTALQMIGAHTDSPGLKVKPNGLHEKCGCIQLGVEVYGGALLAPWFDRELSLAGRVCWLDGHSALNCSLIDFKRPLAIIPSLAIHLDREANKNREINRQTDLVPIIGLSDGQEKGFRKLLRKQLCSEQPNPASLEITDHELFFYDPAPPRQTGLAGELLSGSRLDNLVSCFAAVQALLTADSSKNRMIILNDHEEVGSISSAGARGTFVRDILERILPETDERLACLRRSFLISADNAHGVHPNFADKHDPGHQPLMGKGPVIKINANQRYATDARTAATFRLLCRQAGVPVQEFVMRNDIPCGSTIGPLTAAELGVDTVDVGIASLAMHSIRETAACRDCWHLYRVLHTFFS